MTKHLSLNVKFYLSVSVYITGTILFGSAAIPKLEKVIVHGPHYAEIINGKHLEADTLTPRVYILEPYAVALECLNTDSSGAVATLIQKGETLQREFKNRSAYWDSQLPDDALIEHFLDEASAPADAFFTVQNTQFHPSLAAGDRARAQQIFAESMQPLYEKHRLAILKLVDCTKKFTSYNERVAQELISRRKWLLISGLVVQAFFVIGLIIVFARGVLSPKQTAASMLGSGPP